MSQRFEFVNFKDNLSCAFVMLSCCLSCLDKLACFCFNVASFPDKAGKFTCEILSSDNYNNSGKILPSKTLRHFSIVLRNLSLNFALKYSEPECRIKWWNDIFPMRNLRLMAKGARKSIVVSVFENAICYQKGVVSARPWFKLKIRAALNHPPFCGGIIWSQEIEKANYTEKCHLPIIKEGRDIWRLKFYWNKKPLAHSKKMLNYWWPQSKKGIAISKIEKVWEAPQGSEIFNLHFSMGEPLDKRKF